MTGAEVDFGQVWRTTLDSLDADGVPVTRRAFLSMARLVGLLDDTALIAVPDDFSKNFVEQRLRMHVTQALSEQLGREVRLAVTVDPDLADSEPLPPTQGLAEPLPGPVEEPTDRPRPQGLSSTLPVDGRDDGLVDEDPEPAPPSRRGRPEPEQVELTRLNPKYTFDTFVIGSSNRFANAAAVAVAEAPAKAYNPLFIYGQSGLGKTHLLHAIGHYARSLYPHVKVRYVNSEEFTNDFINSIRDDKAANFQRRYRDVDVLLIDDIQFLQGKMQTQEEFFHTFNTLHNANKQVVITSDVAPKLLSGFEERMRSRFEWGLLTDVQPPDLETRIAILRKKAIQEKLSVPADVLEFIASRISTNIRELEGA
ncbi:MAG TPA: chromosomal replication initiator protein DnaA, partial [Janibacter terrae]|nr:chromosomal replication initiator protein DnaA [Janibacter terrae]